MAMTDEHKAALAMGRDESRKVKAYLSYLETAKSRRGPRPDPAKIEAEIADLDDRIAATTAVKRLNLIQRRMDLVRRLDGLAEADDGAGFEADFVAAAAGYSARKGISYAAWREAGVPAAVLRQAGITRD